MTSRLAPVLLIFFAVACAKSSTPATHSPSSTASARESSCSSQAGLSGPVTDKGNVTFSSTKVALEADNEAGGYEAASFYFSPTCAHVPAGTISIEIRNEGSVEHNFSITSANIDKDIEPGKSISVTVTVPSGATPFFCKYHRGSGMQGAFVVS